MNLGCRATFAAILILAIAASAAAEDGKSDRWFSKDKYKHFAVSAFYSAGASQIVHRHFEMRKETSIVFGFGFTISLGATKELADHYSEKGTSSYKDFVWDLAGTLVGSIVASFTL